MNFQNFRSTQADSGEGRLRFAVDSPKQPLLRGLSPDSYDLNGEAMVGGGVAERCGWDSDRPSNTMLLRSCACAEPDPAKGRSRIATC